MHGRDEEGVRWQDRVGFPEARALAPWGARWQDFEGAGWRSSHRRGAARLGGGGVGWVLGRRVLRSPPLTSVCLPSVRLYALAPRVAARKFPKPGRREAQPPLPRSTTGASGGGFA